MYGETVGIVDLAIAQWLTGQLEFITGKEALHALYESPELRQSPVKQSLAVQR
ncbi:hypothetical protein ACVXG8_10365 [Escherichia coli]